ncbi:MAG TPA: HNH endonuclease signature motif containing protein [Candidatus Limnocylindria bacterium]|nr:HNH endonuclease signature motif containing protein [Candidatus Limnocylindria bacterium]
MKRNAQKAREAMRRWRKQHPDQHRAELRSYYARDPVRRQRQIDASPNRKAVRTAMKHRRRERSAGGSSFTAKEWLAMVEQHGGRCAYCRVVAPLQVDHRTALARGGANSIGNILPACAPCNLRKGTMSEAEFRARLAAERSERSPYS